VGAFAAEGLLVSCFLRMCFVRVLFRAALYVHFLHAYGLTPVCVRMCLVRVPFSAALYVHLLHAYGLTPVLSFFPFFVFFFSVFFFPAAGFLCFLLAPPRSPSPRAAPATSPRFRLAIASKINRIETRDDRYRVIIL